MTAIIGVLCKNGLVIGADSSSTFTAGNIKTIEQKTKKIELINNQILTAGTGHVGFGQRFNRVVNNIFSDANLKKVSHIDIAKSITRGALNDAQQTLINNLQYGALLGYYHNDEFRLCEFEYQTLQPEYKDNSIWYVSMGSGQLITDPFLGFIRRILWGDEQPDIEGGVFATLWALNQAIELNAGGINGPEQIGYIEKTNKGIVAKIMTDAEMAEHKEYIKGLEKHIKEYKTLTKNTLTQEVPKYEQNK